MYPALYTGSMPMQMPPHAYADCKGRLPPRFLILGAVRGCLRGFFVGWMDRAGDLFLCYPNGLWRELDHEEEVEVEQWMYDSEAIDDYITHQTQWCEQHGNWQGPCNKQGFQSLTTSSLERLLMI